MERLQESWERSVVGPCRSHRDFLEFVLFSFPSLPDRQKPFPRLDVFIEQARGRFSSVLQLANSQLRPSLASTFRVVPDHSADRSSPFCSLRVPPRPDESTAGEMRFRVSPLTGLEWLFWRALEASSLSDTHFVRFAGVTRVLYYRLKWLRKRKRCEAYAIKYKCWTSRTINIYI